MSDDTEQHLHSEQAGVGITFEFVIFTYIISGIFASIYCRGLFQDGAYYLYRMAERDWFYLVDPARTTVQVMRQAPVVAMLNLADFSLVRLGQIFSLAMLLWPPLLIAICWFIAPPNRKILTLFPIIHLLVGFSTMSFQAVSEGEIATSYSWVLLFLILFRTTNPASQWLFLLLCIPAFQLHEGACFFTPALLLAIAMRLMTAASFRDRLFLVCAGLLIAAILAYQLKWVIYPRIPAERAGAIHAILTFGFLYFENHFNLPVVTALVAVAALSGTLFFHDTVAKMIGHQSTAIAVAFAVFCVAVIAVAWLVEASLSPPAQSLSRYNTVYASLVLGVLVTLCANRPAGVMSWARGPTLATVVILAVTQLVTDLAATARWRQYIADFEGRLAGSRGLVDWRGGVAAPDSRRDRDWRLMTVVWVHPIMSIILSKHGDVRSIFDYPPQATFRPIDLSESGRLPRLHGVSYQAYRQIVDSSRRSRSN